MKPSAVLLIDLENFYHSRRDFFRDNSTPVGDRPDPSADLAALVKCAEKLAGLPLSVRRAYANFNTLAITPRDLMHRGIEPVQVFCLTDTSNKNAADMKLAMDAVALASSGAPFEHFVLVTGDSDFIPVILELKNRGFGVSAIAVPGSTSPLIRRFVDGFKWFDETGAAKGTKPRNRLAAAATAAPVLDAAGEPTAPAPAPPSAPPGGPEQLPHIAAALQQVLARSGPIRFNQVHRVLSTELGYSFDPATFAAASTGAFIRRNAAALGVSFRGSNNDLEVYLPAGTNGTPEPVSPPEPGPAPQHDSARGEAAHTAHGYQNLFASGTEGSAEPEDQELHPPPWPCVTRMCDDAFALLSPPTGGPCPADDFQKNLSARAQGAGDEHFREHVSRTLPVLRLSNAVLEKDGQVALHPHVTEAEDVRGAVLWALLRVLAHRLREHNIPGAIRAEAFLAAIDAGPLTDDLLPQIAQAIEDVEHEFAETEFEGLTPTPRPPAAPGRTEIEVEIVTASAEEAVPLVEPEFVADTTAETIADGEVRTETASREPNSPLATVSADWTDPDDFDGTIPDVHPPAPAELAHTRTGSAPEADPPEEPSGELDVAAITRALVESSQESAEVRIPREALAEQQPAPEPVPVPNWDPGLPTHSERQDAAPGERTSGELAPGISTAPPDVDSSPPEHVVPTEAPAALVAETGNTLAPALLDTTTAPNPPGDEIPFADLVEDDAGVPPGDATGAQPPAPRSGAASIDPADAFGGVDMIVSPLAPDVPEPPHPPMQPGSA